MPAAMAVDPQAFKQAVSQFASGVTVVTTVHEGERAGLTASSFSSLSLDPPLVLVCLNKRLHAHRLIERSRAFAVNVLGAQQVDLGMRFAGLTPGVEDRFEGIATTAAETGSPLLPDCLAWVDCRLWNRYDGGDHSIFVGEVVALSASAADTPLLYHNRLWLRSESLDEPTIPLHAEIVEVGPAAASLPADARPALVEALMDAGVRRFQVASFLGTDGSPVRLTRKPGIVLSALIGDEKGLERARAAGLDQVDLCVSATEAASRKTVGRSREESLQQLSSLAARARAHGLGARAAVLCAFGCPYEGVVDPAEVVRFCRRLASFGLDELTLVDSTGSAHPQQVRRLVQELQPLLRPLPLALHLRDTRGMGLANVLSALKCGVTRFETALGGRGGPPHLVAGSGNVATENALHMLHEMGIATGIDLGRLDACSTLLETVLEE